MTKRQQDAFRHLRNIALDVEAYLDDQPILTPDEEALLEGVRFALDKDVLVVDESGLSQYDVLVVDEGGAGWIFRCMAEDAEHAIEQAMAEPTVRFAWLKLKTT